MSRKNKGLNSRGISRTLSASLAGARAGGAMAVDKAFTRFSGKPAMGEDSAFARREAARFVRKLGKLKGSYVKIGQMLALFGEHFLPPALTFALHELEQNTDPLAWDIMESAFRDALGVLYTELEIEPQAFAAASLAQVHRARVKATGEKICLKIQYPGLAAVIDSDFDTVIRMLTLSRWVKAGRDLDQWLGSMRQQLHNEIDYTREAEMTRRANRITSSMIGAPMSYAVPEILPRYCGPQVLALEYVEGLSVTDEAVRRLPLKRRNALAQGMLELFFYELYDWGLLQTDPNFGNYLLRLGDRRKVDAQDQLVLLDFGAVLQCEDRFLHHLQHLIAAGQRRDVAAVVDNLIGLNCLPLDVNEEAGQLFADFCLQLLEPLQAPEHLPREYLNATGQYCWASSRLMHRAARRGALSSTNRHFTPPSGDFALIARKLTGVFTFISVLGAQFNAHDVVQDHLDRWRHRSISRNRQRSPAAR